MTQYFPTNWDFNKDIKKLSYKIIYKKSASPTLLIHDKNAKLVYKVWTPEHIGGYYDPNNLNNFIQDDEVVDSLRYESRVYEQINRIIEAQGKQYMGFRMPFLKSVGFLHGIGSHVNQLATLLNTYTPPVQHNYVVWNGMTHLLFMIYLYIRDQRNPPGPGLTTRVNLALTNNSFYRDRFRQFIDPTRTPTEAAPGLGNIREVLSIEYTITEFSKFETFETKLKYASTKDIVSYLQQIVLGIHCLYKHRIVHNDLHFENIMIANNRVLIFDWDRTYSKDLGHNPLLTRDRCGYMCSHSLCNIYNPNGYAIDLYKILFYVVKSRSTLPGIYDISGIYNRKLHNDCATILADALNIRGRIDYSIINIMIY